MEYMPSSSARRRLAAPLFLDIVGSTKLAADLVPAAGYEWIGERLNYGVLRYDPTTRQATTFHLGVQPRRLVGVESANARSIWLVDAHGDTITSIDPASGQTGHPIGLTVRPSQAVVARGSIWVAGGSAVDRISLATGKRVAIALPKGTNATGIAVDPATGALWVDNSRQGCFEDLAQDKGLCESNGASAGGDAG